MSLHGTQHSPSSSPTMNEWLNAWLGGVLPPQDGPPSWPTYVGGGYSVGSAPSVVDSHNAAHLSHFYASLTAAAATLPGAVRAEGPQRPASQVRDNRDMRLPSTTSNQSSGRGLKNKKQRVWRFMAPLST